MKNKRQNTASKFGNNSCIVEILSIFYFITKFHNRKKNQKKTETIAVTVDVDESVEEEKIPVRRDSSFDIETVEDDKEYIKSELEKYIKDLNISKIYDLIISYDFIDNLQKIEINNNLYTGNFLKIIVDKENSYYIIFENNNIKVKDDKNNNIYKNYKYNIKLSSIISLQNNINNYVNSSTINKLRHISEISNCLELYKNGVKFNFVDYNFIGIPSLSDETKNLKNEILELFEIIFK